MKKAIVFSLAMLLAPMSVIADDEADQPAESQALTATVVSVEGTVQYRDGSVSEEDSPWQDLEAGAELNEWTIILTGFRSQAVLSFPNQGEILVRASSMIGIAQLRQEGGETQTRVGLRYGSVRASVDHDRDPGEMAVVTAVATAAPRGSFGDVGFTDFGASFACLQGYFLWVTQQHGNTGVSGGQQSNFRNWLSSWLNYLRTDPFYGDRFGGYTEEELMFQLMNGQGLFGFGGYGFNRLWGVLVYYDFFYSP